MMFTVHVAEPGTISRTIYMVHWTLPDVVQKFTTRKEITFGSMTTDLIMGVLIPGSCEVYVERRFSKKF